METTFGECTDNEKKETVISDCSQMRTEGTSRPSGLVGTAETIISGFYSWGHDSQNFEPRNGDLHAKSMFSGSYSRLGNAIANRSRLTVTDFWWTRTPNLKRRVRNYDTRKPFCEKSLPY